jgi:hypothetical protein
MAPKTTWDFLQLIKSDSLPSGFSETPRHTDRPTPLLLEEKGPGDEVDATKKGPGNDSVSLSVSFEEKRPGDDSVSLSVSFEEKRPGDDSVSLSVSIEEKGPGDEAALACESVQKSVSKLISRTLITLTYEKKDN